ncbi:MAG: Rieske (2Fe-2S) protein [Methanomicrobiales archaeon]|nr:Rieske (2Fe-2S) protein [Methanomicrobiales archaeon]
MPAVPLGSARDLPAGRMRAAKAGDRDILVANLDGSFFAIGNICTHRGCRLSGGILRAGTVQCPCHGSTFDLRTGNVVRGPAREAEPSYPVKVEGDDLWVEV